MKIIIALGLVASLAACSGTGYRPVTDPGGTKPAADRTAAQVAIRYNEDRLVCKQLAHENARISDIGRVWYNWFIRPASLYLLDEKEIQFQRVLKDCMVNRGHSVLDLEYVTPRW